MIIPVRCFTCGKVIADRWERYLEELQEIYKKNPNLYQGVEIEKDANVVNEALNNVHLTRSCCRRMFIGHIDLFHLI